VVPLNIFQKAEVSSYEVALHHEEKFIEILDPLLALQAMPFFSNVWSMRISLIATTNPPTGTCSSATYNTNATTIITNLTGYPYGLTVDASDNIYISDTTIRVYKLLANSTSSSNLIQIAPITPQTINTGGSTLSQIGLIYALFADQTTNNIYMSDTGSYCTPTYCYYGGYNNYRIQRWSLTPGTVAGTTVAGSAVYGATGSYNMIEASYGLYVDSYGTLFVSDYNLQRVTKWIQNSVSGVLIAGTGVSGSNLTQLNGPRGVWVDGNENLFVVDSGNHRVVKWVANATSGVLVAGGLGQGPFSTQLNYPTAIIIDGYGNIFILDAGNTRIQQFTPGSNVGITIFDGSYAGSFGLNAYSMAMDSLENLYVADYSGKRVQKISLVSSSLCTGKV
jgi:hypothetical protein